MDFRFALRSLRKSPGFTFLAIVVMALGIGANTAVFSVVNAVLLRPLSYSDPDRIVNLATQGVKSTAHGQVSGPDFFDWRAQSTAFSEMAMYYNFDTAVTIGAVGEYADVAVSTKELFPIFGITPEAGRLFTSDEEKPEIPTVALISDSFCKAHFGNPARALGQTVKVSGASVTVIGIVPVGFHFPDKTDIWLPIGATTESRSAHNYLVVARLRTGVSLEQAKAQMTSIGARLARQYPASNKDQTVAVTRLRDEMVNDVSTTLLLLLAA